MTKNSLFVMVYALIVFANVQPAVHKVHESSSYHKKEFINGRVFAYSVESINDIVTKNWSIDGQSVGQDAYLEAVLEAEKAALKVARLEHEQRQEREQLAHVQARKAGSIRMLALLVAHLEPLLAIIATNKLEEYFEFDEHTVRSREDFEHIKHVLADAKKVLALDSDECTLAELQDVYEQLEKVSHGMQEFVYASVHNAIEHCNDTRMLKNLLSIVAHDAQE